MLYIGRSYSKSANTVRAINKLESIDWTKVPGRPETPEVNKTTEVMDPTDEKILEGECKRFADRKEQYRQNMSRACYLLWGQCIDLLPAKIKLLPEYKNLKDNCNSIALLKNIKSSVFKFETTEYLYVSNSTKISTSSSKSMEATLTQ